LVYCRQQPTRRRSPVVACARAWCEVRGFVGRRRNNSDLSHAPRRTIATHLAVPCPTRAGQLAGRLSSHHASELTAPPEAAHAAGDGTERCDDERAVRYSRFTNLSAARVAFMEERSKKGEGGPGTHVLKTRLFLLISRRRSGQKSTRKGTRTPTHQYIAFRINDLLWRRGWDSNPRAGYPTRRFRGAPVTTTSVPLQIGGRVPHTTAFPTARKAPRPVPPPPKRGDTTASEGAASKSEKRLKQRAALLLADARDNVEPVVVARQIATSHGRADRT
jgi:hypothetical protein